MTSSQQTVNTEAASSESETSETDVTPSNDDGDEISTDMTFEILKNWRRRQVLRYLRSNAGEARLDSLAEHIAALENDIEERALSSSQRKRVYIALYQCHLPKMADVGVIEYEKARGQIQIRPQAGKLYQYLDLETSDEGADFFQTLRSTFTSF